MDLPWFLQKSGMVTIMQRHHRKMEARARALADMLRENSLMSQEDSMPRAGVQSVLDELVSRIESDNRRDVARQLAADSVHESIECAVDIVCNATMDFEFI